jgi:hypothetical protein
MLTDSILLQVGIILKRKFRSQPLIFLELVLADANHPIVIPHGDEVTLLTGKVDYAILASLQPQCEENESENGKRP